MYNTVKITVVSGLPDNSLGQLKVVILWVILCRIKCTFYNLCAFKTGLIKRWFLTTGVLKYRYLSIHTVIYLIYKKLGRAQDQRTNGTWLSKLTE